MRENPLKVLLHKLNNNEIAVEDALDALKKYYYEDIGYARVDHQRAMRSGIPEVIFGLGKTPDQVAGIASTLWSKGAEVLVTKATQDQFIAVKTVIPSAVFHKTPG